MKTSSSSAASTLTYESDISATLNTYKSCEEAKLFDSLLKKLETVRINKAHRDNDERRTDHHRERHREDNNYVPSEVREIHYGDLHRRDDCEERIIADESSLEEEKLPRAILKLDRRHAIPKPRVKNDVLVEIEVSCSLLFVYCQRELPFVNSRMQGELLMLVLFESGIFCNSVCRLMLSLNL